MIIFKSGAKLSGGIVVAVLISFFLCASINAICQAVFTDTIGYKAHVYAEDSDKLVDSWEYKFYDPDGDGNYNGTDEKKAKYEEENYIVQKTAIVTSLEGKGMMVYVVISQILCGILIISFAGSNVYKQGFKDSNLVRIGHVKQDKLKGFKIGLVANVPFFLLFGLLVACGLGLLPTLRVTLYGYLNSCFYPVIYLISGCSNATTAADLNALQYVLLFVLQLIVPIISGIAYILGFKEINLTEKIVYKKGDK